jgi:probable phosphoglycerate mutase
MTGYGLHQPRSRLLLIRHGQAGDSRSKRYIGQTETSLTDLGRDQAKALGKWLADVPLERLVCSDLVRCRQTAGIIAESVGLRPEPRADLREIHLGDWEGRSFSQVMQEEPEAFRQRGEDLANYRTPGGETFAELQARVVSALKRILSQTTGNAAVVSHAGVNRTALCHWLGLPLERLFILGQDSGGLSILEFGSGSLSRVLALNMLPS